MPSQADITRDQVEEQDPRVPVTVVTGFLGSGCVRVRAEQ